MALNREMLNGANQHYYTDNVPLEYIFRCCILYTRNYQRVYSINVIYLHIDLNLLQMKRITPFECIGILMISNNTVIL